MEPSFKNSTHRDNESTVVHTVKDTTEINLSQDGDPDITSLKSIHTKDSLND